jgi:hypothetical protein
MNASFRRLLGAVTIIAFALPMLAEASAPTGRYVVTAGGTGNGTVYDTRTKLTWQQTATSTTYALSDAKTYCTGMSTTLGGTGWRLPTIKEIVTIIDFSVGYSNAPGAPMIDRNAFPGTLASEFWSSSPALASGSTWLVNFQDPASVYESPPGTTSRYLVRCVR